MKIKPTPEQHRPHTEETEPVQISDPVDPEIVDPSFFEFEELPTSTASDVRRRGEPAA